MGSYAKWFLLVSATLLVVRSELYDQHQQNQLIQRSGLDWLVENLRIDTDTDPYLAKIDADCLVGNFAECFKILGLGTLPEFISKQIFYRTDNVLDNPSIPLQQLAQKTTQRTNWDITKSVTQNTELNLRSTPPIESELSKNNTTPGKKETILHSTFNERQMNEIEPFAARFVDEIADEIDIIEDKKDSIFNRYSMKKLLIPMLIVLKLFKLKLLLFLPLILGLVSFKKLLGFLTIVIPGIIGFYKIFKPEIQSSYDHGIYHSNTVPHYSPAGIGYHHYKEDSAFIPSGSQNPYSSFDTTGGKLPETYNSPYQGYAERSVIRNSVKKQHLHIT